MSTWGTWEELLLGGAILRHGTGDWRVVAAELRARTVCPYTFTPEVCKAKYEDLQHHHSGCKAWVAELRKKRVEELKKALEQSEDSIGSLETKLDSLKAKRANDEDDCHVDRGSSQTESLVPFLMKSSRTVSSSKEISKDGLSAGSFTHETRTNWMDDCQVPADLSSEEMETEKAELSPHPVLEKFSSMDKLVLSFYGLQGGILKRRRGKRKRKACSSIVMDGSVGESDFFGSVDVRCKDTSTSNCCELAQSPPVGNDSSRLVNKDDGADDLSQILSSVMENEGVYKFHRRLDSQKRGRYKKMIRRHVDFDTIRSRIDSKTIESAMELFRDLLLLVNNALVFYSRSTREYKTARLLRDTVTVKLREHRKNSSGGEIASNSACVPEAEAAPISTVKPSTAPQANKSLLFAKLAASNADTGSGASNVTKLPLAPDSSPPSVESLVVRKKGFGRQRKTGGGSGAGRRRRSVAVKQRKE